MKRFIRQGRLIFLSTVSLAAWLNVAPNEVAAQSKRSWNAPPAAKVLKNPVTASKTATEQGGKSYREYCVECHGPKGDGKGGLASSLKRKPADLTSGQTRGLSDGEIFWRISKGDNVMPSFEKTFPLSETERWQLVLYVRSLARKK